MRDLENGLCQLLCFPSLDPTHLFVCVDDGNIREISKGVGEMDMEGIGAVKVVVHNTERWGIGGSIRHGGHVGSRWRRQGSYWHCQG